MVRFRKNFLLFIKKLRVLVGPLGLGRIPGLRSLYFYLTSNPIFIDGYKMYLHPYNKDIKLSWKLMNDKLHEEFEVEYFKNIIKPEMTVLDLGANIGYYTLLAAKLVGVKGRVFAFEPEPSNFSLLSKNVKANNLNNVILVNRAVSNKACNGSLFLHDEGNLGDHRAFDSNDCRKKIPIYFVTVDDFMKEYGLQIDIIKMDIQGFEYFAMEGMKKILNHNIELTLMVEFWPNGLTLAGSQPEKLFDMLIMNNFNIFVLDEEKRETVPTTFDELIEMCPGDCFTNILCVKRP